MGKYLVLALAFLFLGLSCSSVKKDTILTERVDIYLVIGQSNMAGRAEIRPEDKGALEHVFLYNGSENKQWEPAENPLNKYSTIRKNIDMQRLSPAYSFAQSMQAEKPNSKIGLVVNAKGGTGIVQWMPGTHFFKEAVRRTRAAKRNGNLKGIIWHQGESDSDEIRRALYLGRLEEMVNGLREAFDDPTLPFVAGEVFEIDRRIPINDVLRKVPGFIKNAGLVSSEGTTTADNTHFDTSSAILMGNRYAKQMIELQVQLEKSGK
ncbi:MAG: hypothetical protein ACJA01_002133 [Saprospiraceae bacterium]|jgi:hypothetical protein